METTRTEQDEAKFKLRLEKANNSLTAYRGRIQSILASGPDYLTEYAAAALIAVGDHIEVTKDNGDTIRDGVMEVNNTYRAAIYYGLVERGELETGFALLHDTIHDAANLTNDIYFLSKKW